FDDGTPVHVEARPQLRRRLPLGCGLDATASTRYDLNMDASFFAPLTNALADSRVDAFVLAGYLAGSIPFGLILANVVAGKDGGPEGSGNIGATNVARVVGKKLGVVVLILDAAKGFVPVFLVSRLLAGAGVNVVMVEGLVALAALLGHCFPIWLKLRGGKGVA